MYYYHQKLTDSNKQIYIYLRYSNLFSNSLENRFSQSQKRGKALITIILIIPE